MLTIYIVLVVLLLVCYCSVLLFILSYWNTDENIGLSNDQKGVSIIIAARNEEAYINDCLQACLHQETSFPYEVIVTNDGSDDNTLSVIKSFNHSNLVVVDNKKPLGKKTSLRNAIDIAKYDTLLFTDGDCVPVSTWVQAMNTIFIKKSLKLLSGPIEYNGTRDTLSRFQYLDNINNMAMTNAGIKSQKFYSANGANIMYSRSVFYQLGGYEGNQNLSSGDDVFMMHKVAEHDSDAIDFCTIKDSLVYTQPEDSLPKLVQQRKRWATKTQGYTHQGIVVLQGIVFLFVLTIPIGLLLSFLLGIKFALVGLVTLIVKSIIDFFYLSKIDNFFSGSTPFRGYVKSTIAYLVYILIAGYFAIFPSEYTWKGRVVK